MEHVFHRFPNSRLPVVSHGDGMYVYDTDGKEYLDGCGGAAVSCLGHSDSEVKRAIVEQLDRIPFAHTAFYTSEAAETLADRLTALAPGNLSRVYFTSGGSEATETALKMARQYFVEKGEPDRCNIITRRQSYHGNTLGALAAGGNQWRRAQFEPLLFETHNIAPCYEYRDRREDETAEAYGLRVADELDAKINALGAETVIAFIAETVVGATAGAVPPAPGYFKRIREICDRHGVLLILDEVMCGTGRTGTMFACEQDGIASDLCGLGFDQTEELLCITAFRTARMSEQQVAVIQRRVQGSENRTTLRVMIPSADQIGQWTGRQKGDETLDQILTDLGSAEQGLQITIIRPDQT